MLSYFLVLLRTQKIPFFILPPGPPIPALASLRETHRPHFPISGFLPYANGNYALPRRALLRDYKFYFPLSSFVPEGSQGSFPQQIFRLFLVRVLI